VNFLIITILILIKLFLNWCRRRRRDFPPLARRLGGTPRVMRLVFLWRR
jgi:hypothetical protein